MSVILPYRNTYFMEQQPARSFWEIHRPILLFLGVWAAVNLFQAWWLPLDPDEAYYWMYAQRLDWGYFDHPPMVALLARLGIDWIPGALGVRLGNIGMHIGTIFLFWQYLGKPEAGPSFLTWASLCLGLPFLHLYGIVATPDGPLLFFTVSYLYLLQQFAQQPHRKRALLLGAVMAALLYSKYHGILVIFFTLIAHWRLWKDPRFWLACAFGAFLFMPHLIWQYQHDFPSFRYHLKGRDDPYEWAFTWTYLLNQCFLFSPFLFPLFIRALGTIKKQGAAVAMAIGFWGFFLYSTTKGHVEPQWTAVLSFPLALLAFEYSKGRPHYEKWLRRAGLATFAGIALARIMLMLPIPGFKHPFQEKQWPKALNKFSGSNPVVFENSYRDASEYAFYTGQPPYTFTNVFYRPSQFDIWDDEKRLHNQRVLVLIQPGGLPCKACDTLELPGKTRLAIWADRLQVAQKVQLSSSDFPQTLRAGQEVTFSFDLFNPYPHAIYPQKGNMPLDFQVVVLEQGQVSELIPLSITDIPTFWPAGQKTTLQARFTVPQLPKGEYTIILGLNNRYLPPGWNSMPITITYMADPEKK
ncbi:MAG: glycosyltransferase family 39 protein [Saprospiraceae bacterium]